jgi:signal transduction histidine kinase
MRRRLTIAILGVVVGTLVLTIAGGLLLVRRAATSTAQSEVVSQARSLGELLSTRAAAADQTLLRVLRKVGSYQYLAPVGLSPSGTFESLPYPLTSDMMDVSALQEGRVVEGSTGNVVFAAVPTSLNLRERAVQGILRGDTPVLVVTKVVANPVNGVPYFLAVGGVVLAAGVLVAAFLAKRTTAPLLRAVSATRKMTAGDLSARVPVREGEDPELVELSHAINSLGESLARSRGLQRQFLMSVSHELRTPLTSIRGYADALSEDATDDVAGAAAIISGESRRLERLVRDLLDLARLDAGQFSLDMQRVDAASVAEAVADGLRPEAANLGIDLDSPTPLVAETWVDADPDRLAQIVANLVENAFKFADRSVEVGVTTSGTSSAIWVRDDGPGIDAADLPRVFERHFRSDRSPARHVGTGLGLAIVAELATAMGARVNVESPMTGGRGTSMSLWMAAKSAPQPRLPPPPLPTPRLPTQPPSTSPPISPSPPPPSNPGSVGSPSVPPTPPRPAPSLTGFAGGTGRDQPAADANQATSGSSRASAGTEAPGPASPETPSVPPPST